MLPILIIFVFCTFLLQSTHSTSQPPITYTGAWFTGVNVFPTQNYYGNGSLNLQNFDYTISLSKDMPDTNYKVAIGLQQLFAQYSNGAYGFYFQTPTNFLTFFTVGVMGMYMSLIQTITINYIVINYNWGNFQFNWIQLSIYPHISSSNSYTNSTIVTGTVDMTGTVKTYSTLTGFDIITVNTSSLQMSLILSVKRISSSYINYTLSSNSQVGINVKAISFIQLSFNLAQIQLIPGGIVFGTFDASSQEVLEYVDYAHIIYSNNTLLGVSGFHTHNENFLNWNIHSIPGKFIKVASINSYRYFQFNYLIFKDITCNYSTPYLLLAQNLCYDSCPAGQIPDNATFSCVPYGTAIPSSLGGSGSNVQLILLIVLPILVGLALIALGLYCFCKKYRKEQEKKEIEAQRPEPQQNARYRKEQPTLQTLEHQKPENKQKKAQTQAVQLQIFGVEPEIRSQVRRSARSNIRRESQGQRG